MLEANCWRRLVAAVSLGESILRMIDAKSLRNKTVAQPRAPRICLRIHSALMQLFSHPRGRFGFRTANTFHVLSLASS
jgi:hypothetical protein